MELPSDGALHAEYDTKPGSRLAIPSAQALAVILLLAVDQLNPVKMLCNRTSLRESHVATGAFLGLLYLLALHSRELVYYLVKVFFRSTLNNIFFSSVEIIGMENLPKSGPVILTGNHNNQFVDGALLLTNCRRQISFMIAEKSWKRPGVGHAARLFQAIPVARPQDLLVVGAGKVVIDGSAVVRGEGTRFTAQCARGAQLQVVGLDGGLKVMEVVSDTEIKLDADSQPKDRQGAPVSLQDAVSYKVLPKVDHSKMYESVFGCLGAGRCFGIFPEGGSHDRRDLLPLKAGVAIIALEAHAQRNIVTPIVPVGLNYFKGHQFRGRVVVEFGRPIHIDQKIHSKYEEGSKREATDLLLKQITSAMRSVIVPAPDWRILQLMYTARRLYVRDGIRMSAEDAMDLDRRFAVGMHKFLKASAKSEQEMRAVQRETSSESIGDTSPKAVDANEETLKDISELAAGIEDYNATLKRLGLRDHQVMHIQWWSVADLVGRSLYLMVMCLLGAIPQLLFNLPVGLIARYWASVDQRKALSESKVKIAARDVVMSYKIIYCLTLVPMLYFFYILLLFCFSGFTNETVLLLTIASPLFSLFGVKASDQGVSAYADIVPLVMHLLPAIRAEQDSLPARRAALQKRVRKMVKQMAPLLGDLYSQKDVDWSKEMPHDAAAWAVPSHVMDDFGKARSRVSSANSNARSRASSGSSRGGDDAVAK